MKVKVSLSKRAKKILAFTPVAATLVFGTTYAINKLLKDDLPVVVDENKNPRRVYLVNSEKLVIPVTVKLEKQNLLIDDLHEVVLMMKENSSISKNNLKGALPKNTEVMDIAIGDSTVTFDFSSEFSEVASGYERQLIESLVWTATQYDTIDSVIIKVGGETIERVNDNSQFLPSTLTRENVGINFSPKNYVEGGLITTVIYDFQDGNRSYYVPVSEWVSLSDGETTYDAKVKAIFQKPAVSNNYEQLDILKGVSMISNTSLADNILTVNLNDRALIDESAISKAIYEILILCLKDNNLELESVDVEVDGEAKQVSGVNDTSSITVDSIIYNQIQL